MNVIVHSQRHGPSSNIAAALSSRCIDDKGSRRHAEKKLRDLIDHWTLSPEWSSLTPDTQRVYKNGLKKIGEKWGDAPLEVADDPRMYAKVMNWRAAQSTAPAAADNTMTALSSLLAYGVRLGWVRLNVAFGIGDLYALGRRAKITWTEEEVQRFVALADEIGREHVADAVLFAYVTGFRLGDLVSATTSHLKDGGIVKILKKPVPRGLAIAEIPSDPDLDEVLVRLLNRPRASEVDTLLVNRRGEPWKHFNLDIGFRLVRNMSRIGFFDTETEQFFPKHLHDFRGTKATRLLTCDQLSDEEVATRMGWSVEYVAKIRWVYVDDAARVRGIADQIAHHSYEYSHSF